MIFFALSPIFFQKNHFPIFNGIPVINKIKKIFA